MTAVRSLPWAARPGQQPPDDPTHFPRVYGEGHPAAAPLDVHGA